VSTLVGRELPQQMQTELDGRNLETKSNLGYLIVTVDEDGAPRPCMLSVGEILVMDEHTIRLAVWPNSTTAANLRRGSGVLLSYVAPNTVLYVRGHTLRTWQARVLAAEIGVDQVTTDEHPGFTVTDGIRFEYEGRSESLATTWGRQLALLREVS